jgi:hypothetical protein
MKKLPLFILAAALTVFATSCSKEKTCSCDTSLNGVTTGTTSAVIEDGECSDLDSEVNLLGSITKVECTEE